MDVPDGGLAFPFACQGQTTAPEIYYGMTLRDWFAGLAMQSLIISTQDNIEITFDKLANEAFEYAEAMVERGKN